MSLVMDEEIKLWRDDKQNQPLEDAFAPHIKPGIPLYEYICEDGTVLHIDPHSGRQVGNPIYRDGKKY